MMNKKTRRHSGRKTINYFTDHNENHSITYWDDWMDYRDSQRNVYDDRTLKQKGRHIDTKINSNKKIVKQIKLRKQKHQIKLMKRKVSEWA